VPCSALSSCELACSTYSSSSAVVSIFPSVSLMLNITFALDSIALINLLPTCNTKSAKASGFISSLSENIFYQVPYAYSCMMNVCILYSYKKPIQVRSAQGSLTLTNQSEVTSKRLSARKRGGINESHTNSSTLMTISPQTSPDWKPWWWL